jgi:hypothetical protein
MKKSTRLVGVGGIAIAATALLAGQAQASPADRSAPVFVQTDNLAGNTIVAYDRAGDGSLHQAGTYQTGGKGGALTGAVVDFLASQGSLAYDRANGLLYAVNAGSNTVTVFTVHGDRLTRHQVITSGWTFPVNIAVRGNVLYVLNARDGAGQTNGQGINGFGARWWLVAPSGQKITTSAASAPSSSGGYNAGGSSY